MALLHININIYDTILQQQQRRGGYNATKHYDDVDDIYTHNTLLSIFFSHLPSKHISS